MHLTCTSQHFCTTKTTGPRKRQTVTIFDEKSLRAFLIYFVLFGTSSFYVNSAVWINGPEDRFFCGYKWDDDDCQQRQHCPSGRSEECEGNEDGIKCFANTNCDTRYGDGDWFVSGQPPKQSPGGTERPTYSGKSDDVTDYYWCGVGMDDARNKCGSFEMHCPGGTSSECPAGHICYHDIFSCDARNLVPPTPSPTTTKSPTSAPVEAGPTELPTYSPLGPPDPLPYPSDDPTDHWWCGIGIDDANNKCRVHCPSAHECPMGNICYFGTQCDARTHSPTPPPTRRPTDHPVPLPTLSPTFTMLPTTSPTFTSSPTAAPSEQGPTTSPTQSPTKRPTWAPMPSLQSSFFCGTTWNDAITNCKKRCPGGESTECPFDEKCFSLTPCTEELGYPEEYGLVDVGAGGVGGSNGNGSEGGEACVPFKITIVADHWPKETSWLVENTELGEIIAEGNSDDLVPGEPVEFVECVNNRYGCYEFTIKDSGGDGICCEHGNGSYKISYDGEQLAQGNAFYDHETTPFGFCGTELPTKKPTKNPIEAPLNNPARGETISVGGGKSGESAYRCVANPLVESGYEVSNDKCNLFVDCYNQYIDVGDDFFCNTNEQCVGAPACGGVKEDNPADEATAPPPLVASNFPTDRPTPKATPPPVASNFPTNQSTPKNAATAPPTPVASNFPTNRPTSKVSASRPSLARPKPGLKPKPKPGSKPSPDISKTESKSPTPLPVTVNLPTKTPTLLPTTYRPTYGPCGGAMCNQKDHCRSPYGFCGPGDIYCNDKAIWTNDCPSPEPTYRPSPLPVPKPPTNTPIAVTPESIPVPGLDNLIEKIEPPTTHPSVTMLPPAKKPSSGFKKPSGGKKPGGGKGSLSKPATTHSPVTYHPTKRPTIMPVKVTTNGPTDNPRTAFPSPRPIQPPTNRPFQTEAPFWAPVTVAPTNKVTLKPSISRSEPNVDYSPSETQPEVETIEKNPGVDISETNNFPTSVTDTSPNDEDDYDCSGEPCPVDTHCRSRYGSCGPGFIYCNLYSIWTDTCPPPDPFRPTKTPTARPTHFPTAYIAPKTERPTKIPVTTFPPLAKPSLPIITEVTPFEPPSSFTATDKNAEPDAESDTEPDTDEDSDEPKSNDAKKTAPTPSASPPESNQSGEYFQSEEYLNEWAAGRMAKNDAILSVRPKNRHYLFFAATSLIFFRFFCFVI